MSENNDKDRIIEKIKKLLEVTEARGATPTEAATAARHAESMLRKYNLEMADVIAKSLQEDRDAVTSDWARASVNPLGKRPQAKFPHWASVLAVPVSEMFDCHAAIDRMDVVGVVVRFFGYRTDVAVCKWTYHYLVDQVVKLSKEIKDEDIPFGVTPKKYREDYRMGVTTTLCEKLREIVASKKQQDAANTTSTALVVAKRSAVEAKFGKFNYQNSKQQRERDPSAFHRGRRDGHKINVNPNPLTDKSSGTTTTRLK